MLKKFFGGTDLFKNISTLVTGTLLAQLIPVLLQTLLRRIYPAEDFGAYAVFISLTGIFMVASSFRYEMAVVMPDKRNEAVNLAIGAILLSLVFNSLLFLVSFIFRKPFMEFLNLDTEYSFLLTLLPLVSFLFSSYQILNYYLVRYKRYKSISLNKFSRRFSEGIGQTTFGLGGFFSSGLIWGNIAGHIINLISGIFQVTRSDFSLRLFSWTKQRKMLKRYREFPTFNLIPALLNSICMHLPIILVNKFFTGETAAYFDLSRQVLVLPASILSLSISQVMLQNIAEKRRKKESFRNDLYKIILLLGALATVMVLIFSIWAPYLFGMYAGADYQRSGEFARILVFGSALKLIVSPLSSIFAPLGQIKKVSIWHTFYFTLILSLSLLRNLDIITFLKIYLLLDILAYSILFVMIFWVSNNYEKKIINTGS